MNRCILTTLYISVPSLLLSNGTTIDYSREILPILAENCFECHGPDEGAREADLRLDNALGAYADLVGAVAIATVAKAAATAVDMVCDTIANLNLAKPRQKTGGCAWIGWGWCCIVAIFSSATGHV